MTERLGDYVTGTKQTTSSAVDLRSSGKAQVISSSPPKDTIILDRTIDEDSSDGTTSVIVLSPHDYRGDTDESEANRPP